jgi:hypothetical protein
MAALFYLPKGVDIVAYDTAVRSYMNGKGYDDSKISYDPNSGYVQYNGNNFLRPQKNYQGSTYSDQDTLNQADQAYRKNYGDPNAAQSTQSSVQPYSAGSYGQSAISALAQPQQQYNTNQNQINDTLNYLRNYSQNQQPFDVYSSPQYQSALSNANYLTQQNIRGAQEALGTAGLGRSSALQDEAQRLGNIQQQNLMTQVVPQIIQQHQAQQQQQYQNALSALDALMRNNQNQFNQGIQQAGITGIYNPYSSQVQQMQQNSADWFNASPDEKARLAATNQQIGALIGAKQDAQGNWIFPQGQRTLAGQQTDLQREEALYNQGRLTQQDHINLANQLSQQYGIPVEPKDDPALMYAQVQGLTPLNAQQVQSQIDLQKAQGNYYNEHGNYYDARAGYGSIPSAAPRSSGGSQKPASTPSQTPVPKSMTTDQLSQIMPELDTMRGDPYALRSKILSLNLPDEQTLALLKRYGQGAKPPTSYSGGR